MQTVIATDLARNTHKTLDQVASRRKTVMIKRNCIQTAKITSPEQTMTAA